MSTFHNEPNVNITCHYALLVVWTNKNPSPWNTVKPDENTKLMAVNQKFEKRYVRTLHCVADSDAELFIDSWSRDKL